MENMESKQNYFVNSPELQKFVVENLQQLAQEQLNFANTKSYTNSFGLMYVFADMIDNVLYNGLRSSSSLEKARKLVNEHCYHFVMNNKNKQSNI